MVHPRKCPEGRSAFHENDIPNLEDLDIETPCNIAERAPKGVLCNVQGPIGNEKPRSDTFSSPKCVTTLRAFSAMHHTTRTRVVQRGRSDGCATPDHLRWGGDDGVGIQVEVGYKNPK